MSSRNIPKYPSREDKVGTAGSVDRSPIYQIYGKVVNEEEWTQFHQKIVDLWKNEEKNKEKSEEKSEEKNEEKNGKEKIKERMSNRNEYDKEEVMGENHHLEDHSLPEGTVAILQFPIQQPEGIAPMKNISSSVLPRFHGKAAEDPDEFLFKIDILCRGYDYITDA